MSVWGVELYDNDITVDLRDLFRDFARYPLAAADLLQVVTACFPCALDPEDNNYTSFWLAAADQYYAYGIDDPVVRDRAMDIIHSNADLDLHESMGIGSSLKYRAKMLASLEEKLSSPNPKPKKRNLLKRPEAWAFDEGDLIAYPSVSALPFSRFTKRLTGGWDPDGWSSFAVLIRFRILDFFPVYLIAALGEFGQAPPGPELLSASKLLFHPVLVTHSSQDPKRMELEKVAQFTIDEQAIYANFEPGRPPLGSRPELLANALVILTAPVGRPDPLDLHLFMNRGRARPYLVM
ncbi:MAG: hypothetical protein IT168_09805 [Bryobacterales bacterium]|nr:hypothetical protein [Bryobacterales bacterium]